MVTFGFFAALTEFSPAEALEQTVVAEEAGFERIWVEDHFHPWFDHLASGEPADCGNAWEWIPLALDRTENIEIGTGVTAVLNRYHPANVAHRLATLMDLFPERVFLGLGAGEALNEKPLGNSWPDYGERAQRTAEAIRIIRKLFAEEYVDYEGSFWSLDTANLYTGPDEAPPIHVAASGPTSARMAGDLGDGFLTVYQDPDTVNNELFPAIEQGIAKSKRNKSIDDLHTTVLIHCSYAESMEAATEPCKPWRLTLLPVFFDLGVHDPRYLQRHGDLVGVDQLVDAFLVSTEPADFIEAIQTYIDCGFDEILFQSSSPDQTAFCEMMREEVFPSFT